MINTNLSSLVSQQHQRNAQSSLHNSMERLSSGLRINSAKDDAAGQAVANRMTSQINGHNQAQRNMNDGISYAQSAGGYLDGVNDNLQRVRELTVQALNGTNTEEDLTAIQAEIEANLEEIERVFNESEFNGTKIFSGDSDRFDIQAGYNDGEIISTSIENFNLEKFGLKGFNVDGSGFREYIVTEKTTINREVEKDQPNTEAAVTNLLNLGFEEKETSSGVTRYENFESPYPTFPPDPASGFATFGAAVPLEYVLHDQTPIPREDFKTNLLDGNDHTIGFANGIEEGTSYVYQEEYILQPDGTYSTNINRDRDVFETAYFDNSTGEITTESLGNSPATFDQILDRLKEEVTSTGRRGGGQVTIDGSENYFYSKLNDEFYSATVIDASDRSKIINVPDGSSLLLGYDESSKLYAITSDSGDRTYYPIFSSYIDGENNIAMDLGQVSSVSYYAQSDGTINTEQDGTGEKLFIGNDNKITTNPTYSITVNEELSVTEDVIEREDGITTKGPLAKIDESINQIDEQRSHLGSFQNRLESAIENSQSMFQDLTAARSRIEDADYAAETASLVKSQILQQASTSMLAQANQAPELVLRLLD